ncbi:MAG TPA: AbrB/MazE/SpoVT family DNA-binding domain-containing protein [Methanosarcinales archaeon]|nr:AbrB/MazE/SpoVT family DNA-binding domain-containing protein [Methanosarcinales archaeon]
MNEDIIKVGERGQVVIPAQMRKKEGIEPNSYVRIVNLKGKIIISKIKLDPIEKLIDALADLHLTSKDWDEIQKERDVER